MYKEENVRKILECLPQGIIVTNILGEILFVNSSTEVLFNYKREELLGRSAEILIPENYQDLIVEYRNETYEDPHSCAIWHPSIYLLGKRKSGEKFNVEVSLSPLETDEYGHVMIATVQDITERLHTQDELKRSQDIFQKIFEYSLNGIIQYKNIRDENGKIIDFKYVVFNKRALEITDRKKEDLIGKTVLQLNPWVKEEIFQEMLRVAEKGGSEIHEYLGKRKGVPVWYRATFIKMDDGLILTFDDITDRKQAEQKLIEANMELEKKVDDRTRELLITNDKLKSINEKLDRYAFMISHDLKAPLANIEGIASILKQDFTKKPLDNEGKEMLDMMTSKTNDMRGIIENVLQSAKDEIKSRETINVVETAQEVIETLNPPSYFHFFIQHNLPPIKYPRASIVQILQNLLSNAIKYMDKPNPLITISSYERENFYVFCVTDNGRGIPPEKKKKIFALFEVAHDRKNNLESYGIGLAIVKQLVEENGGKIWVESILGEETKFHFSVPKN